MGETQFVLTNDDAGMQEPKQFSELLDFLAEQEVPGTFFVVPAAGDKSLALDPVWLALLDRALEAGHDLQLHGYTHRSAFEFGLPPDFMLDIMPQQKAQWEQASAGFTASHSYVRLAERLSRGRDILSGIFGYEPQGFRATCLSVCDNLYHALHDLGFQWSSNQVINPAGWRYINRQFETRESWQAEVPPHPYRHASGVIEAPLHSEYSWYLTEADVARQFRLARDDFDRARANGDPFIPLSHYFAMTGQWSAGLSVYRQLFEHARARGAVRFVTLSQLIAQQASSLGGPPAPLRPSPPGRILPA